MRNSSVKSIICHLKYTLALFRISFRFQTAQIYPSGCSVRVWNLRSHWVFTSTVENL